MSGGMKKYVVNMKVKRTDNASILGVNRIARGYWGGGRPWTAVNLGCPSS